jgi:hypothetical protein
MKPVDEILHAQAAFCRTVEIEPDAPRSIIISRLPDARACCMLCVTIKAVSDAPAIAEVVAKGHDGRRFETRKEQPVVGVSGTEMLDSQFGSILRAAGILDAPIAFV